MTQEKINIAELLKDCPKGMELDCVMFNKVTLLNVDREDIVFPIRVKLENGNPITFTKYGQYTTNEDYAKCVIFPKGKTTWEGFVPPCKFKPGDVLVSEAGNIVLLSHIDSENFVNYHCIIPTYGSFRIEENTNVGVGRYYDCVLANEQQRQSMYDKIKCSGFKYNQSTNKLEKLIVQRFKVGDRIKHKYENFRDERTIVSYGKSGYWTSTNDWITYENQDDWDLVPNKFDITTLEPFESRVLVRDKNTDKWKSNFWGFYDIDNAMNYPYECCGNSFAQCIPYKGNEHLLGKTDGCDEYYKTWK